MAKEEMKTKTNIGSSTLILIFIVLCLSTFGLLSLASAKSDWNLAAKNAEAVKDYYRADQEGTKFLAMADRELADAWEGGSFLGVQETIKERLAQFYDPEGRMIGTDIPMERGQALRVELELVDDADIRFRVRTWKVYHTVDYEIDDSLPVWDGSLMSDR